MLIDQIAAKPYSLETARERCRKPTKATVCEDDAPIKALDADLPRAAVVYNPSFQEKVTKKAKQEPLRKPRKSPVPRSEIARKKAAEIQRENDAILKLAVEGYFNREIASLMNLSYSAVKNRLLRMGYRRRPEDAANRICAIQEAAASLGEIEAQTCEKYGITLEEMQSSCRVRIVTQARREYAWRARRETNYSWTTIGKVVHKDHTSMIHGADNYERWRRVKAGIEQPKNGDTNVSFGLVIDLEALE